LLLYRTSSLNSLSSFDQLNQPIPDDRSSVVSDFSRRTSGAVSPSELPDSPTQTVPPSPKSGSKQAAVSSAAVVKRSVFEDDVASYRQEGTPSEFSRGTSLSSLTVDRQSQHEQHVKVSSGGGEGRGTSCRGLT
jgi:adenomatosis polyposis coli protein